MELYQLKYFLCAARYENISKAAQVLRVTQPSVSKAIMALEKELQTELFVRSGKRIVLSYAGRTLRDRMMPVIAEMDDIFGDLHRLEDKKTIKLNLISVDETYVDDSDVTQRYFPATSAMVTAPGCGHLMYGQITQIDHGSIEPATYAATRVPKFILDQPNDKRKLRLACRPLAAPHNYCPYIYAANVVG